MKFDSISRRALCALTEVVLLVALMLALAMPARAQNGFNIFEEPRTLVLQTPTILTVADAPRTTMPFDLSDFDGIGTVYIVCMTNNPTGTLTVALEDSTLGTNNFAAISNCAYASSTTFIGSNTFLTNLKSSNTYMMPGTIVTPTASTAGFSTPYLLGAPFTNTVSALSLTASPGVFAIGFNVPSVRRYLRMTFTTGGTATNITVSAVLVARTRQPRYF